MAQKRPSRLQIFIDPSIRARVNRLLKAQYGHGSRGLSLVVREALIKYLESRGF